MVQLQKVIFAVGMFSIFESQLQTAFGGDTGHAFQTAKKRLIAMRHCDLASRFDEVNDAINALKHGRGRSYDRLVAKIGSLPFRVLAPDEHFYEEGDVSELHTLVRVDDRFVALCGEIINQVAGRLKEMDPDLASVI